MKFKALITLDLPGATGEQRNLFNEYLESKNWKKIEGISTAWRVPFTDGNTRDGCIGIIKNRLTEETMTHSKVKEVKFATQLHEEDVKIETLKKQ